MLTAVLLLSASLALPVATVGEAPDTAMRRVPGRVVPVAQVEVRPQVSGEILSVAFSNGQQVAAGDVLYRLDPVKYVAAEKNAEAKVVELKATFAYATTAANRYGELVRTRAVSQDDLDRARMTRDTAQASLAAAEADLVAAKDDVRHCTVVAPIAGRVGSTLLTEGNYVQKGGAGLVTLVQTDPIRIMFELSSVDYDEAFGGDAARLVREGEVSVRRVAGGDVIATGRVEYVENLANAATDSIRAYVLVENGAGVLLGGQTVMVSVSNPHGVRRATVPPNAIAQDMRGHYVWVLDGDGKAALRRIVRGPCVDDLQLVVSGLRPGERVVADGVHRVREGMEIVEGKPE